LTGFIIAGRRVIRRAIREVREQNKGYNYVLKNLGWVGFRTICYRHLLLMMSTLA
jgi:hypothetical protein